MKNTVSRHIYSPPSTLPGYMNRNDKVYTTTCASFTCFYAKTTRYVSFYTRWERKNKSSTRTTPKQFPNFVIRTALVAMIGVKEQVRWRSSFIWPSRKPKKATVESFSISRQNVEAHKHAIAPKQSSDPKLYKTETRIKTNKNKKKTRSELL